MDPKDRYRESLEKALYRDCTGRIILWALVASVACSVAVVNVGANNEVVGFVATLGAILGGLVAYLYYKNEGVRIRQELERLRQEHEDRRGQP